MLQKLSDRELARQILRELKWDSRIGWSGIEVQVNNGVVNKITIQKRPVDPAELREQIEYALERRADREAERLRVDVNDGAVDLWGRVHSWQEKRAVIGSIGHALGVTQVRDHLRIDPYF